MAEPKKDAPKKEATPKPKTEKKQEVKGSAGDKGKEKTEFWNDAPSLEIPWPPCADTQSKHTVAWDKGPKYTYATPEVTIPKEPGVLFEAPPIQLQTPIPGLVIDLFAKAEYALKFGGELEFALQKEGKEWSATGTGKLKGSGEVSVTGGIGVGAGAAGISAGVSGNLTGTVSLGLEAGLSVSLKTKNGKWSGTVGVPLKAEGSVKVTPSASLYVKVMKWKKDLATLKFGEWTIATAGVTWTPTVEFSGGGAKNKTTKPVPWAKWGKAPEVKTA